MPLIDNNNNTDVGLAESVHGAKPIHIIYQSEEQI
jgi:hypothetical protein